MKKNTAQLVVIITLICATLALLGIGIWFGVSSKNKGDDTPKKPSYSIEDEGDWTDNY